MARENSVMLVGRISNPSVTHSEESESSMLTFSMAVLRSNKRIDYPRVAVYGLEASKAYELCSQMKDKPMAIVKGVIETTLCSKTVLCPICGGKTKVPRLFTRVVATGIPFVLRENYTPSDFAEVSNNVKLLGEVCTPLQSRNGCTLYQLNVDRSFRIGNMPDDERHDRPWIKSFGSIGEEDAWRLSPGSVVYISGALQTRYVDRIVKCTNPCCECEIKYPELYHEVITSRVEYLHNCDFAQEGYFDVNDSSDDCFEVFSSAEESGAMY